MIKYGTLDRTIDFGMQDIIKYVSYFDINI